LEDSADPLQSDTSPFAGQVNVGQDRVETDRHAPHQAAMRRRSTAADGGDNRAHACAVRADVSFAAAIKGLTLLTTRFASPDISRSTAAELRRQRSFQKRVSDSFDGIDQTKPDTVIRLSSSRYSVLPSAVFLNATSQVRRRFGDHLYRRFGFHFTNASSFRAVSNKPNREPAGQAELRV